MLGFGIARLPRDEPVLVDGARSAFNIRAWRSDPAPAEYLCAPVLTSGSGSAEAEELQIHQAVRHGCDTSGFEVSCIQDEKDSLGVSLCQQPLHKRRLFTKT
ncbi:hypothetical protein [Streptomyces sp. S186]|uniref:hypothetical protein n=1 Tax=Streptomyces sp. S186 TaxID=3434395 RepID=UPI003F663D05